MTNEEKRTFALEIATDICKNKIVSATELINEAKVIEAYLTEV